ncbi:hypothetical protein T265_01013 [Opisthorchis viverrini]|uniref:Uncharacterized protein n=1 Tax=Opisthorchis viverrini TaxID=6198 RepID=A0A075AJC1_OPIVI|nr:hypothetical protein T265_01013 [Opisthorchis viverrini]KER33124.1 hypothetical protein T265_01013 [Opisthorchis viverrini]
MCVVQTIKTFWIEEAASVPSISEEDENYCYMGCCPITNNEEVSPQKDNHRSVCGSCGCTPLNACEQAVPPIMDTVCYTKSAHPSVEVCAHVRYTKGVRKKNVLGNPNCTLDITRHSRGVLVLGWKY